jgi:hypothetical protein
LAIGQLADLEKEGAKVREPLSGLKNRKTASKKFPLPARKPESKIIYGGDKGRILAPEEIQRPTKFKIPDNLKKPGAGRLRG